MGVRRGAFESVKAAADPGAGAAFRESTVRPDEGEALLKGSGFLKAWGDFFGKMADYATMAGKAQEAASLDTMAKGDAYASFKDNDTSGEDLAAANRSLEMWQRDNVPPDTNENGELDAYNKELEARQQAVREAEQRFKEQQARANSLKDAWMLAADRERRTGFLGMWGTATSDPAKAGKTRSRFASSVFNRRQAITP